MVLILDFVGVLYDTHSSEAESMLFDDVLPFLQEHKADKLILLSSNAPEVLESRVEQAGISSYFDMTIGTAGRSKGEVLAEYEHALDDDIVIVDDNPRELDAVMEAFPSATCVLMERFPEEGGLTISEFDTVSNLTELEALIDAREEDF